ncbi:MAG: hypothetical protein MJZ06_09885 [Bacteroidaceae bacterium]|nr:hypothetical protein [Bacteroidaceae bacterium]
MKAHGHLSEIILTDSNWRQAEECASRRKRRRKDVARFEKDLDANLAALSSRYSAAAPHEFRYTYKVIREKKERFLSMLEYPEHVFDWGILLPAEPILNRAIDTHSYACIKGRGQHQMIRAISDAIYQSHGKLRYALTMDVSKMYANIPLWLPKRNIRRKIKDPLLLHHFDEIIDSSIGTPMGNGNPDNPTGVAIGLKISTMIANMSLCYFDHDLRIMFRIGDDSKLLDIYAAAYVERKKKTARTKDDFLELQKGDDYLIDLFRNYVKAGLRYIYRFMDNIFVLHEDKTFLHMVLDWCALYLAAELRLPLNPKWQVVNLKDGLHVTGYRIYGDGHIRVGKDSKTTSIRKILKGRKMGLSDEQIRRACSSNIGAWKHANAINLTRKYNMEKKPRLGAAISKRKSLCPFDDLGHSQQRKFEAILYDPDSGMPEDSRMMELQDVCIIPSIKETNDDGTPKDCLAIRFIWQGDLIEYQDDRDKTVRIEKDKEYFSYTGSKVLIEQVRSEFTKEDLPAPTVITIAVNKRNKKFYKFT